MNSLVDTLPATERNDLHREFHDEEPTGWVSQLAREKDWRAANEAFLKQQRSKARKEMQHLMEALHIAQPVSAKDAADLVSAAVMLMVEGEDARRAVTRLDDTAIQVRVYRCSTYQRLENSRWRGVTACSSWHRRQGWYEAMGVSADDWIQAESLWGDEACETIIQFR